MAFEIFWRFLALGCTSFGGPAAHLAYFRATFVDRLAWLDGAHYGRLVAASQVLPGPGSSQVCFAIGLERGGLMGGLAAFLGFTLPSFLLLSGLGVFGSVVVPGEFGKAVLAGTVSGLKLLAVVVVADAARGMYADFCRTIGAAALAIGTACLLLIFDAPGLQLVALVLAAVVAGALPRQIVGDASRAAPGGVDARRPAWPPLALVGGFALILLLPGVGAGVPGAANDFFLAGLMVFGGGHVVLPLLQNSVGAVLGDEVFLTGYAAAQAVPGPMFTLASYLGAVLEPSRPWLGALSATLAVFAPGLLLMAAFRGSLSRFAARPRAAAAAAGVNAAVVGLLLAALYSPVLTAAVRSSADAAFAVAGLWVLGSLRPPILVLVLGFAVTGALRAVL
jgi:chromate transporter